jgi:hypothetical protein
MANIFISYSSQDKERIYHLADMLSKVGGWSVWFDREIPTGREYDDVIEEELMNSGCVVVVWSKQSIKSPWVKTEAQEGYDRRCLIPILIDDAPIPIAFRRLQTANLSSWNGSDADPQFKKLIKDITSILSHQQDSLQSTVEIQKIAIPRLKLEQLLSKLETLIYNKNLGTITFIFLIAIGWAICDIAGLIIMKMFDFNFTFHYMISGVISGLTIGYILRIYEPLFSVKKIIILAIGWGIGWYISGDISEAFIDYSNLNFLAADRGRILSPHFSMIGAVISGTTGGAIGGLVTGYVLDIYKPTYRLKKILAVAIGWTIGGAIGFGVAKALPYWIHLDYPDLVTVIRGAVFGAIGSSITFWYLNPMRFKP